MGSPKEGPFSHSASLQVAAGATGKKNHTGFQRPCLCLQHGWGTAADSAFFPNASLPEGVGYSGERHSTGLKQSCGFGVLCREAVSCFSIY